MSNTMSKRRQKLQRFSLLQPSVSTPGSYSNSISWVNPLMQHLDIGLSKKSYKNMIKSMRRVTSGDMLNAQASAREGKVFFRDIFDSNLSTRDRIGSGIGFIANSFFGPSYHYNTDLYNYHRNKNQSREMRMVMHSHIAGDLFS